MRYSGIAAELHFPFVRPTHTGRELDFQQISGPGKTDERRDINAQEAAGFLRGARQHQFFQIMRLPKEVALHAAPLGSAHHEEARSTHDKFFLYAFRRTVAGIVIGIADEQDGVSRLVRPKKRESFMQRVP